MKLKVIKNAREHAAALKEIDRLWDAKAGSPKAEELDLWVTLVEAYESKAYAILPPDPVEAIKFRMEQEGLTTADLSLILGGRNRVSEVLSRRRALSTSMMRNLHRKLRIPAESLLGC